MATLELTGKVLAEKEKTKSVSGSIAVLEAFLEEGVDIIFGYPGGSDHANLRRIVRLPGKVKTYPRQT